MPEEPKFTERGYNTKDVETVAEPSGKPRFARRHWGKLTLAAVVLLPALIFTIWSGMALGYTYSSGDRVGYVQKLSKRGYVCKTWEGELGQSNFPGQAQQLFAFTVRGDSLANVINLHEGKQVALTYDQHIGIPSSCFGDTEYFVTGVRIIGATK